MWGLLFDLDGTLALTNAWHEVAWREVLEEHGVSLSHEGYATEISGRSNSEIVTRLLPHLDRDRAERVWMVKEECFRRLAKGLEAPAGLRELVTRAAAMGVRLGVVTNAPRANAVHVLDDLGMSGHFDRVLAVEDVEHPKPHPDLYSKCAKDLGLLPQRCLAFEDSPSGVKSAVAAGVPVVGLLTGHTAEQLTNAGAMIAAADFFDQRIAALLETMAP